MRYKHFRSHSLFAGSGAVEAGCKAAIGQRLELSGMHWHCDGATGILTLRCRPGVGRPLRVGVRRQYGHCGLVQADQAVPHRRVMEPRAPHQVGQRIADHKGGRQP